MSTSDADTMSKSANDANPNPGNGYSTPMDDSELQAAFVNLVDDAGEFTETELSPIRETLTNFYFGNPFGNEEQGRSQVVLTEVRDGVLAVLPPILRAFAGPDQVVEFVPRSAQDVAVAQSETAAVRYCFMEENNGFLLMHSALKDGLVRRMGIAKWGWNANYVSTPQKRSGVTHEQAVAFVAGNDDVTLTRMVEDPQPAPAPQPPSMPGQPPAPPAPPPPQTYTIEYTVEQDEGALQVWSVPPEEFIFDRQARDLQSALFIGHRRDATRGELIALGVPIDTIDSHLESSPTNLETNVERIARQSVISPNITMDPPAGEANTKCRYVEAYVRLDYDGDGIAELRRITSVGDPLEVVTNEPWDQMVPFALFCPDPEPHTIAGQGYSDRLMDLQKIKSMVMRATLDSASASIFDRMVAVEGQVNLIDLQNTEIGSIIRARAPGMVQPITHTFMGRDMLGVLEYLSGIAEHRTGQSNGAMGLDASALQSSTETGVQAALSATQAQQWLLAMLFGETFLKPLFRGLRECLRTYQKKPKMVRDASSAWLSTEPASWPKDRDVTVNVGLGMASTTEKITFLTGIATKQEQAMQVGGPGNPLAGLGRYRYTLGKMAELAGFKDTTNYFAPIPLEYTPPPSPPPAPSPDQVLAQAQLEIEKNKVQKDLVIAQSDATLQAQKQDWDHQYRMAQLVNQRYIAELQFRGNADDRETAAHTAQADLAISSLLQAEKQHHDLMNAQAEQAQAAQDAQAQTPQAPAPEPPPAPEAPPNG